MEKIIYKEKEYEVKYLREAQRWRRGEITVAYIDLEDGTQLIGLAERSPRDPYDEEQAKIVSFGRLEKKTRKRKKNDIGTTNMVENITQDTNSSKTEGNPVVKGSNPFRPTGENHG